MNAASSKLTLSIDWEDFGQLICRDVHNIVTAPLNDIDRQTDIILEMLDERDQKATFFVLGMLAKYKPDLVKKIDECGHEIAMHGSAHNVLHSLTPAEVKADLAEAFGLISGITGKQVFGYRAPCFSIRQDNLEVLGYLAELGIQYDSSIFPVRMPRYGIDDFDPDNRLYQLPGGLEIVELPLTTLSILGRRIPVAGGGYIRLMPKTVLKRVFHRLVDAGVAPMIYMHPYEFDSRRLDSSANFPADLPRSGLQVFKLNLKWNIFRKSIHNKIDYLLQNYEFVTCKEKSDDVRNNAECKTVLG